MSTDTHTLLEASADRERADHAHAEGAAVGDDYAQPCAVLVDSDTDDDIPDQMIRANENMSESALDFDDDTQQTESINSSFFTSIKTVNTAEVPLASVPPTMQNANLVPLQRQALYWMQRQERNDDGRNGALHPPEASPGDKLSMKKVRGKKARGGIFADTRNLGKTRVVIALCENGREEPHADVAGGLVGSPATLILCPSPLLAHWQEEIEACVSPAPRVLLYHGSDRRNLSTLCIATEYDYVLTSYQTLQHEPLFDDNLTSKLHLIHWKRIVLDEAHCIRGFLSQQTSACLKLSAERFWAVTPTPVVKGIDDLFPLLRFLRVPYFGSRAWWLCHITDSLLQANVSETTKELLRYVFSTYILWRAPNSLKPNQNVMDIQVVKTETVMVELHDAELECYTAICEDVERDVGGIQSEYKRLKVILETLRKCRLGILHHRAVLGMSSDQRNAEVLSPLLLEARMEEFLSDVRELMPKDVNSLFAEEVFDSIRGQKLAEERCVICYFPLRAPVVLPCLHIFCNKCVEKLFSTHRVCATCNSRGVPGGYSVIPPELLQPSKAHLPEEVDISAWEPSAKTVALLEHLKPIPDDMKAVVFCASLKYLEHVQLYLHQNGVSAGVFSHTLKTEERKDVLRRFRMDSSAEQSIRVLLVTFSACALGMDLSIASHCFMMEPHWNPAIEDDAISCLQRIGQGGELHVVKFLGEGTMEVNVNALAESKRKSFASAGRIRRAELLEILPGVINPNQAGQTSSGTGAPNAARSNIHNLLASGGTQHASSEDTNEDYDSDETDVSDI
ncbi:DNA repair protein-like protein [Trypanosoma grayi]|uniref:DNA repair protein-like protein n=1 Tax=Trypanosoma grayi TaxID=71804 RepID=UPI0004F43C9A|nr:DNA repair protein-like protein [Trypanosoma grayi]KEG15363.1 DNA repair protein-like protein [Trypanosoma grayi]